MNKEKKILQVSNPSMAQKKLNQYIGKPTKLHLSTRKEKKYMVNDGNKFIHFGDINAEDYTKHKDDKRRASYLARAKGIKGDWKKNKYSANNLAINVLW